MQFGVKDEVAAGAAGSAFPPGVLRVSYSSAVDGASDWALAWPPATGRTWAVVLHGHGSHGDQLYTREDVRRAWLTPLRAAGAGILTPNLRDNAWMAPAAATDLHDLLDWARRRFGATRFVFVSGSMGGSGNLIYATLHPGDCAAVVALGAATDLAAYHDWCAQQTGAIQRQVAAAIETAYGGPPARKPELYRQHSPLYQTARLTMPVFLAHGERDTLMPVSQMRALAAELAGRQDCVYSEMVKGGHDAPLTCQPAMDWLIKRIQE